MPAFPAFLRERMPLLLQASSARRKMHSGNGARVLSGVDLLHGGSGSRRRLLLTVYFWTPHQHVLDPVDLVAQTSYQSTSYQHGSVSVASGIAAITG